MTTLHAGEDRVTVDPDDGARLVSWVAGGRERLVQDVDPADQGFGHGAFVMAPWAGRIGGATIRWDGDDHPLPRRMGGNAIHGLVDDRPWTVVEATDDHALFVHHLGPDAGPWAGCVVRHDIVLDPDRLRLRLALDAADHAVPVALGWHPCFQRSPDGDVCVVVPADQTLAVDDDNLPTGRLVGVAGDTDLRTGAPLGDRRLDLAWVDVHGPLEITWPDLHLTMANSPELATAVVFTPSTHLCVEPQSAWPDPVHLSERGLGTGLATVPAGGSFEVTTTWSWSPR